MPETAEDPAAIDLFKLAVIASLDGNELDREVS
jgi:hypothetical protein